METVKEIRQILVHTINKELRCQYNEWKVQDGVEVENTRVLKEIYLVDYTETLTIPESLEDLKIKVLELINNQ